MKSILSMAKMISESNKSNYYNLEKVIFSRQGIYNKTFST